MRVIAGEAKGRTLRVPPGLKVRPSASRLRESLFGMLESRGLVAGARVLDLFAGTGGLGIEALSRGAATLVAIEQDREVAALLRRNLEHCRLDGRASVLVRGVAGAGPRLRELGPFDLVLVDPPYRSAGADEALAVVSAPGVLAPAAVIAVETARERAIATPPGLLSLAERTCGDSKVVLLRAEVLAGREVTHDAQA